MVQVIFCPDTKGLFEIVLKGPRGSWDQRRSYWRIPTVRITGTLPLHLGPVYYLPRIRPPAYRLKFCRCERWAPGDRNNVAVALRGRGAVKQMGI